MSSKSTSTPNVQPSRAQSPSNWLQSVQKSLGGRQQPWAVLLADRAQQPQLVAFTPSFTSQAGICLVILQGAGEFPVSANDSRPPRRSHSMTWRTWSSSICQGRPYWGSCQEVQDTEYLSHSLCSGQPEALLWAAVIAHWAQGHRPWGNSASHCNHLDSCGLPSAWLHTPAFSMTAQWAAMCHLESCTSWISLLVVVYTRYIQGIARGEEYTCYIFWPVYFPPA